MRKLVAFTLTMVFGLTISFGQRRYIDTMFTHVSVSKNVMYGWNYTTYINPPNPDSVALMMDVYQPVGDTVTNRPVVILAHSGSFLPKCTANTLPFGDKEDSAMVEMCTLLAKRGYVAVSMDYRLGWNPVAINQDDRTGTLITAIYLAMQDMKACVRYMKSRSIAYNIDKNKIVVGGSNSGGYVALTCGALTDTNELRLFKFLHSSTGKPMIDIQKWGDFDGNNGTPGYFNYNTPTESNEVQLILNLGGAILDTSWINAGEPPIIAYHGVADSLTPYKTFPPPILWPMPTNLEIFGSYYVCKVAQNNGNQNLHGKHFNDKYTLEAKSKNEGIDGLFPFFGPDRGYEPWAWYDIGSPCIGPAPPSGSGTGSSVNPWATKTRAIAYIDTIIGYFCPRAVQVLRLSGNTVGLYNYPDINKSIDVYPNPSDDIIYIQSENEFKSVMIYDVHGKLIYSDLNENNFKMQMDVSTLQKGMYIMNIETGEGISRKKIVVQ